MTSVVAEADGDLIAVVDETNLSLTMAESVASGLCHFEIGSHYPLFPQMDSSLLKKMDALGLTLQIFVQVL